MLIQIVWIGLRLSSVLRLGEGFRPKWVNFHARSLQREGVIGYPFGMPNDYETMLAEEERNDRSVLIYTLIAICAVMFVFYLMLGVQVETVHSADFQAASQVTWVCPLSPFH